MECIACEEPITNPLCPQCVGDGIRQWLLEEGNTLLARKATASTESLAHDGTVRCVRCHGGMAVCPYCTTREVFGIVRTRPALVERYLTFCNFDLEHLGWERDAREVIAWTD